MFRVPGVIAASSAYVLNAVTGTMPEHQAIEPALTRPRCSSILHLFGPWLFEAAFIGSEFAKNFATAESGANTTPSGIRSPNEMKMNPTLSPRPSSLSGPGSSLGAEPLDLPPALTPDRFESGRAEAIGALCRIFCAKKTGEEILPSYLARFYMAVQQGLKVGPDKVLIAPKLEMIL